jgi:hypothetical protein
VVGHRLRSTLPHMTDVCSQLPQAMKTKYWRRKRIMARDLTGTGALFLETSVLCKWHKVLLRGGLRWAVSGLVHRL